MSKPDPNIFKDCFAPVAPKTEREKSFLAFVEKALERDEPKKWEPPASITEGEWITAQPAPPCIVENFYYADVGVFIAPGGTGKTTLVLFEAVHIALGLPLFDLRITNPGRVVILTAEDSREMLVARLRFICNQMNLDEAQMQHVRESIMISDVSGTGFKLTEVRRDVVAPSKQVESLTTGLQAFKPAVIFIDPAVSFGVGESRINDAEQGLVDAGRRIRNELGCAVIYVHHTGKQSARDKVGDQYAGRGGSAFADGSRMVQVLQVMEPKEWLTATGDELAQGETGFRLTRPKLSYAQRQGDLFIKRRGHLFARYDHSSDGAAVAVQNNAEKLLARIKRDVSEGKQPTQNGMFDIKEELGMTKNEISAGIRLLLSEQRIGHEPTGHKGRGGVREYLRPMDLGGPE